MGKTGRISNYFCIYMDESYDPFYLHYLQESYEDFSKIRSYELESPYCLGAIAIL